MNSVEMAKSIENRLNSFEWRGDPYMIAKIMTDYASLDPPYYITVTLVGGEPVSYKLKLGGEE